MVDQNVYALSIALDLEAALAFDTLEKFGQAASDVEKRVSTAATKTINSIAGVADTLDQNLSKAAVTTQNLTSSGAKLEATLAKAADSMRDASNIQADDISDLKERLSFLEDIEDIQEKLEKSLTTEQETGQEYLKLIDRWTRALESKNLVHIDEGNLVEQELDLIKASSAETRKLTEESRKTLDIYGNIARSLKTIFALIELFDSETENYVEATFRVYGSQQQLVQQTRALSAEHGILRKQALETYAVLGRLKIPREELDKYARTVAEANRFTGMGIQELGNYAFRMRQVGMDAAGMRKQIRFAAEMMRKFGLSAADVNSILSDTGLSAASLDRIFRGKDQAAKYQRLKLVIAGLGKQIGFTSQISEAFFKNIEDPIQRELFADFAGQSINSVEDMQKAIGKASVKAAAELNRISDAVDAGRMTSVEAAIQGDILAKAYGFGSIKAMEMAASLHTVAQQMGLNLANAADFTKAMEELTRRGMDPFDESNKSLTAQLNIMKAAIAAIMGHIAQFAADAILPLLVAINKFNVAFGKTLSTWFQSIGGLTKLKEIWQGILKTLSPVFNAINTLFNRFRRNISDMLDSLTDILNADKIDYKKLLTTIISGITDVIVKVFQDFGELILVPLIDGLATAFSMWGPIVWQKLKAFGSWLWIKMGEWRVKYGKPLWVSMKAFGSKIFNDIWVGLFGELKKGETKWDQFGNWFNKGLTKMMTDHGPGFLAFGKSVIDTIWKGFFGELKENETKWDQFVEFGGKIIDSIWVGIFGELKENETKWDQLYEMGMDIIKWIWDGMLSGVTAFFTYLFEFGEDIVIEIGKGIVKGFVALGILTAKLGAAAAKGIAKGMAGKGAEAGDKHGKETMRAMNSAIHMGFAVLDIYLDVAWARITGKVNPNAKNSPSMVELFETGFAKMGNAASTFGDVMVDTWVMSRKRAEFEFGIITGLVEKYASLMEQTATMIKPAGIVTPAVGVAADAMENAIRSEVINTVQVMDQTEGESKRLDDNAALIMTQTTLLASINDKLDNMKRDDDDELITIVSLLKTYLPSMANTEGLTTELNQWMK